MGESIKPFISLVRNVRSAVILLPARVDDMWGMLNRSEGIYRAYKKQCVNIYMLFVQAR